MIMHFIQTEQSHTFAQQAVASAKSSGLIYGPIMLALLLFSAWVKLGRMPIANYAYAFDVFIVLFVYYYNNIIRRGLFFNNVLKSVLVSEGKLFYITNPWVWTKSKTGEIALKDLSLTKKTVMKLNVIELLGDHRLYILENSLTDEKILIALLEQGTTTA